MDGLPSMETLGPRIAPGLAEVPSPGTSTGVAPMLATLLDFVALFLISGSGMVSFPFEPSIILPFLLGKVS